MVIERFIPVVKYMRRTLKAQCAAVTAATLTLDEDGPDGHADAVRQQLAKIADNCRVACDAYNKLRSLTAEMERANGVESPAFYVQDYVETGEPVVTGGKCDCGRLCSVVDLAALNPADGDLDAPYGVLADAQSENGRDSDENGPKDDSHYLHVQS